MNSLAVLHIGGKQYLVKEGDEIVVDSLNAEAKSKVKLPILMLYDVDTDKLQLGTPELKIQAEAEVTGDMKGNKIRVAKFKSKVRYRRVVGFRPNLTKLKILNFS